MGLFSNMPMCELGEQKYYTCTDYIQAFIHNCQAHLFLVSKIRALCGLHVQIVSISASSPGFIIQNSILIYMKLIP